MLIKLVNSDVGGGCSNRACIHILSKILERLNVVTCSTSYKSAVHSCVVPFGDLFLSGLSFRLLKFTLASMISIEQWRAAIGCFSFSPAVLGRKLDVDTRTCKHDEICYDSSVMCCLLVYASIVAMLLIVSGNVELNQFRGDTNLS